MSSSNLSSSTPAPRRPSAPGASLRTQRPTTYYDTEKDSQSRQIPSESKPNRPPPGTGFSSGPRPSATNPSRPQPAQGDGPRPHRSPRLGGPGEKSKIGAALLNKRQSVSYGRVATKSPPQPLPPMPPLPGRTGTRNDDRITVVSKNQNAGFGLDMDTLAQDDFDAEQFMKIHLATMAGGASDPETLRTLKNSLRAAHLATNQELQENAYKNYSAFVAISKEIATLENEMLELKSVLEEFKTLPNDLDMGLSMIDDNSFGEVKRKGARNSIADVNALYKTQLEALWESVEGSQKFLPIQPGRHIVSESTTFVELNPITYQPKQAVHLFLLNDSLLIATRKQTRIGSGKVKLIAEKCFNLVQISIADLSDAPDLTNAIQIQRNREKVVLRTDRFEEKRALLNSFKKVVEEIARRKRKQSIMEAEQRTPTSELYRAHLSPAFLSANSQTSYPGTPSGNQFHPSKILGFGKDDPTGRDLSWIGDISDELSVTIACRQFDQAIELVEKSKLVLARLSTDNFDRAMPNWSAAELNAHATLKSKIEEKSQELLSKLLEDLLEPTVRKAQLVRIAQLITRLNGSAAAAVPNIERAKENFLAMRSELVRRHSRQIKFEGDLLLWVSQSAFVLFTLVKNTCEWYMTAFRDNRMASGFVRWAVEQIEFYGDMFRRQVYEGEEDNDSMNESIGITKVHAGMLKEVGLDFGFLLESVLSRSGHALRRKNGRIRRRSVGDQHRSMNPESSGPLRRQRSWEQL